MPPPPPSSAPRRAPCPPASAAICHRLSQGLLVAVSLWGALAARHCKVEESFQVQATHDLYYYGVSPAVGRAALLGRRGPAALDALPYDHLAFPGVVPRTFLGPLVLSALCRAASALLRALRGAASAAGGVAPSGDDPLSPAAVEYAARFFLLAGAWSGWFHLASALRRKHHPWAGSALLAVTACQFHTTYYASRMLPNVLATVVVLHGLALWVRGSVRGAAALLVATAAVLRCDALLLVATAGLSWLLTGQLTVGQALGLGVRSGLLALVATVPLDSLLWQRFTWPEGYVLFYNTALNKSSDWGTSPWHWYWTTALPKALLLTAGLVPLAVLKLPELSAAVWNRRNRCQAIPVASLLTWSNVVDLRWLPFVGPALGYVALYSFLGHKEVRFLYPVLPLFNLAAAVGLTRVFQAGSPSPQGGGDGKDRPKSTAASVHTLLWRAAGVAALLLSLAATLAFVEVSRHNYPGGAALEKLSWHLQQKSSTAAASARSDVRVYLDVAAAMTGASRFAERQAQWNAPAYTWTFAKGGYEEENAVDARDLRRKFTHLITEDPRVSGFRVVATIPGNPRWDVGGWRVATSDALYVLESERF